mgnify:FL=1
MDLISIRRKYKNIRNIIITIFLITVLLVVIIGIKEIYINSKYDKIYKSYSEQYDIALSKQSEMIAQAQIEKRKEKNPQLTEEGKNNMASLYHSENKRVFLTFDDGPSETVTIPILETLKNEGIKATFFVLGSRVELYPELVKKEYDEGHYIASHGYSHEYSKIYASPQSVLEEYNKTLTAIQNALGDQTYNPHLFRFPGGYTGGKYAEIKKEAAELLKQNNITYVDWNSLTSDAAGAKTTEQFLSEIDKTVGKKNSIVLLMHDAGNKKATAEALPQIISYFKERGFEFDNFYSIIK